MATAGSTRKRRIETYVVLAVGGLLLFNVQSASADESCDQCKYLRCLKGSVERKQNLIAVYQGLLDFWKGRSVDASGNPLMERDLGSLPEPDRSRIGAAAVEQLSEYALMEESRTGAVPGAEGCGYPDTGVQAHTDTFVGCESHGLVEAMAIQPCQDLANLIAQHEGLHQQTCEKRQQPLWPYIYTDKKGVPHQTNYPSKAMTPAGAAAGEIAAYQLEINDLKPIIEKLKKRCQFRAAGHDGPVSYSGVICSLEKPFEVTGNHPLFPLPLKFVPSSATAGTMSYSAEGGMISMTGAATYTVEGIDAGTPRIAMVPTSTACAPMACSGGSGPASIQLLPLEVDECN